MNLPCRLSRRHPDNEGDGSTRQSGRSPQRPPGPRSSSCSCAATGAQAHALLRPDFLRSPPGRIRHVLCESRCPQRHRTQKRAVFGQVVDLAPVGSPARFVPISGEGPPEVRRRQRLTNTSYRPDSFELYSQAIFHRVGDGRRGQQPRTGRLRRVVSLPDIVREELEQLAGDWRRVLVDYPAHARPIIASLLQGHVTLTPLAQRGRWELRGEGTLKGLFGGAIVPKGGSSPTGFVDSYQAVFRGQWMGTRWDAWRNTYTLPPVD